MATTKKKKPRLAPLPILRAGTYTAEQVLRHVAKLIEAEPKRLEMRTWCSLFKGVHLEDESFNVPLPACGTAACAGGWINLVTRTSTDGYYDIVGSAALRVLGLSDVGVGRQLDVLFSEVYAKPPYVITRLREICTTYAADLQQPVVVPPARRQPTEKGAL